MAGNPFRYPAIYRPIGRAGRQTVELVMRTKAAFAIAAAVAAMIAALAPIPRGEHGEAQAAVQFPDFSQPG